MVPLSRHCVVGALVEQRAQAAAMSSSLALLVIVRGPQVVEAGHLTGREPVAGVELAEREQEEGEGFWVIRTSCGRA
jgi:hypothetical protein